MAGSGTGTGTSSTFGWGDLIPLGVSLGSKVLGNKLAPDAGQQSAKLQREMWEARRPFNLGTLPQPTAQQVGTSDELKRMLSGEGYNEKTLTQMKAGAIENPANAGLQEQAQMKRALGQAGMLNSGAYASSMGTVARQTGQKQTAALRDVDLQNAETGMENFRTGVQTQTDIGKSNMQEANAMALNNANRMFDALAWNNTVAPGASSGTGGSGGGSGEPSSGSGLGSKLASTAGGLGLGAMGGGAIPGLSAVPGLGGGLGAVTGALSSIPVAGWAAAGALAAGIMWKKSQAHPTADKWVQGEQNPFDQSMAKLDQAGLPPEELQQAKQQNVQNYLGELMQFAQQGGHNAEVARNAMRTFRQWYGDPSQYGMQVPF